MRVDDWRAISAGQYLAGHTGAAERSRATPLPTLASARCTSVAGFTAITSSPVAPSGAPLL